MFASFLYKIHLSWFTVTPVTASFPLIYCRRLAIIVWGLVIVKQQIDVSFLCVCPLIDDKFRLNNVKVYCGTSRLRLVVPQPL